MESILKDALSGGVLRDEISILLIGKEGTFAECLEEAVKLDSAYRARPPRLKKVIRCHCQS